MPFCSVGCACRWVWAGVFALFGTLTLWSGQAVAADKRVVAILGQWDARANEVKSLSCAVDGEFIYPKDRLYKDEGLKGVNKGAFRWHFHRHLTLDFVKQHHRLEIRDQSINMPEGTLTPVEETYAYNGKHLYWLRIKMKNQRPEQPLAPNKPDLSITSGYVEDVQIEPRYYPMFFAAGRVIPVWEKLVAGRLVPRLIDPDLFVVHGETVLNGRPCTILRSRPEKRFQLHYDEYWVDVERQAVILRHILYTNDKPHFDTTIQHERRGDYWIPSSWRHVVLSGGRRVQYEERVTSVTADLNPALDDSSFVVNEEPGMLVLRLTAAPPTDPKKPVNPVSASVERFRVNDDGSLTPVAFRDGVEVPIRWAWWVWVSMGVGAAALAALVFFRYRRRTSPT